jgi:Kef-type K+ transport system membrane component KefB/Trk K+ transport system NAD-binding subunit
VGRTAVSGVQHSTPGGNPARRGPAGTLGHPDCPAVERAEGTDLSETLLILLPLAVAFLLISLASKDIGRFFSRWHLPLITGFLFTGILAGPYVLGLIPAGAPGKLHFVDQVSLAVIAFAAGSELYLKEMRSRLKSIAYVTVGQVLVTFVLGAGAMYALIDWIPALAELTGAQQLAPALLAGAILVARSPSSAIAIVNELRAKGPFTSTALGVTVLIDVAVIVLFAICFSISVGLLSGGFHATSVLLLLVELVLSIGAAYGIGRLLATLLSVIDSEGLKSWVVLGVGYGVFEGADLIEHLAMDLAARHFHIEPLLICMVAGFVITNRTDSREDLARTLERLAPAIYIAFFTLVGASLELDVIAKTWAVALVLFVVRIIGIMVGSSLFGGLAGDPRLHNRVGWMAYVTQAGVALGLAKGVDAAFPGWGSAFASTMIALIVFNQVVGPPFMKWALTIVGERRTRADGSLVEGRSALLIGVEGQSLALARLLHLAGWQVKLGCVDSETVQQVGDLPVHLHPLRSLDVESLKALGADSVDALVSLLPDDDGYRVCELAYEHFGTRLLIARIGDRRNIERFQSIGVMVIDPAAAMVSLLDRSVRSPATTSLLLGLDDGLDMLDVEVANADVAGLEVRELRLPLDVAILCVRRDGVMLPSKGTTELRMGDLVTLSGPTASVEKAALRLEA